MIHGHVPCVWVSGSLIQPPGSVQTRVGPGAPLTAKEVVVVSLWQGDTWALPHTLHCPEAAARQSNDTSFQLRVDSP